jgi:hypothetical protein
MVHPGSAFDEGRDLPADDLKTNLPILTNELNGTGSGFELDGLIALNAQASTLWNDLMGCFGSAEKARQAYYRPEAKCGSDEKIKNFVISVRSYLLSTQPPSQNSFLEIVLHPVLTEVLLENAYAVSWIPQLDSIPKSDMNYFRGLATDFILEGYTLSDLDQIGSPGNRKLAMSKYWHLASIRSYFDVPRLLSSQYRQVNSISLLKHNKATECGSFGLWPGVSRLIANVLSADRSAFTLGADEIAVKYMKACGDVRYTPSPYTGGGSRNTISILKEFRRMSNRFSD